MGGHNFVMKIALHILTCAFFGLVATCAGQNKGQPSPPDAAAMVNEHIITKQQVFDLLARRYPGQTREVVRELVVQWIIRREYQAEKIKIKLATIRQKADEEIVAEKRRVETELKQQWGHYLRLNRISEKELYQEAWANGNTSWRWKIWYGWLNYAKNESKPGTSW